MKNWSVTDKRVLNEIKRQFNINKYFTLNNQYSKNVVFIYSNHPQHVITHYTKRFLEIKGAKSDDRLENNKLKCIKRA